jgi:hypothetical protein
MAELIFDDDTLKRYLADGLPPSEMARVEKALRDSAALRERLEEVRANRGDDAIHTLAAIWKRGRLSCPTREQLGSYLLEALEPEHAEYIQFHIDVVECPFCRANLQDLESQARKATPVIQTRRQRIFQESRHLLNPDEIK